jgi:[acyl-carrier-protein] S-malonyltransferase
MAQVKTAFVFPGQGSQVVGMGIDAALAYPAAQAVFAQAEAIVGGSLRALMEAGPEAELGRTVNTQPALFICSMALLAALRDALPGFAPAAYAGHSLGELSALTAAGAMDFADGLRLVATRGRLMEAANESAPGAMAAVLGLDLPAVEAVCQQAIASTGKVVVVANDNCPGQLVISGDAEALEAALGLAKAAGAKRALRLAVSIASHSPLMSAAAADFRQAVQSTSIRLPGAPVYANITAAPLADADAIRAELAGQLTSPVRWTALVQQMLADGITHFVEIGSKDVLSGLIRRIVPEARVDTVNSAAALGAFVQDVRENA